MKKTTRKKSHSATRSKIAVAATILAIPLLSLPGTGFAEGDNIYLKIRSMDKFSIAGSSGGHTVYKNTAGKFFYLDPNGDMKFITLDPPVWKIGSELKKAPTTSNAPPIIPIILTDVIISSYSTGGRDHKHESEVSILGVDAKGNTVHENSRGEKFYLDAITGDMIFVDGKGLTAFRNPTPDSSAAPGIVAPSPTGSTNLPGLGESTRSGTASITSNGQVGVVPDLPGERAAPGLPTPTTQAGIAKAGEAPMPDYLPGKAAPKKSSHDSPKPPPPREVEWQPYYSGTAPPPPGSGEGKLPGLAGEPIPGIDVKLGKNPGGSIVASSKTDSTGAFHFDKLPAGNYELKVPGLPDQLLTVGADGIAGGKLMKGSDGSLSIFDRWGNRTAASPKDEGIKAAGTPFGFGSGNTPGAGPGMSAGPGMGPGMSPGAGSAMGGPMSPGPSPMGGGPGGPGAGMRR